MKHTQAPINTAEGGLRVVAILVLIPLAIIQVANQTLAGFTEPVSLERRYLVAGGQISCTQNPGTEESKKNRDAAPEHTESISESASFIAPGFTRSVNRRI